MIVLSYDEAHYLDDTAQGVYVVRDYYGVEVFRSRDRVEAEFVLSWARNQVTA